MAKKKAAKRVTASTFYDDVVRVLGEKSAFTAGTDVPSKDVIDQILSERGMDRDSQGNSSHRKDNKPYVVLRIEWAFRNQRADHRKTHIYCEQGSKRGMWSLTELGVERARTLSQKGGKSGGGKTGGGKGPVTVAPDSVVDTTEESLQADVANVTAEYLANNWEQVYTGLCHNLGSRLRRSKEFGLIEDHVMTFLTRCIAKDSLRRYISQGNLTMTRMTWFAIRSAISEMRPWGKDPVTRALRGAHTETEIRKWNEEQTRKMQDSKIRVDNSSAESDGSVHLPEFGNNKAPLWHHHFGFGDLEEQIADIDCAEKFLAKIEEVLQESSTNEDYGDQLCYLTRGLCDHGKTTELAREMGMNRSTVSNRVQTLKRTLLKARDRGEFREFF